MVPVKTYFICFLFLIIIYLSSSIYVKSLFTMLITVFSSVLEKVFKGIPKLHRMTMITYIYKSRPETIHILGETRGSVFSHLPQWQRPYMLLKWKIHYSWPSATLTTVKSSLHPTGQWKCLSTVLGKYCFTAIRIVWLPMDFRPPLWKFPLWLGHLSFSLGH